ncbi:DNA-directed RNA polymerase sigma-70 factor [Chitinophaga cymbidii]|uniref:DNA-directed RNA polymerase sigma-70 factor n=1 Tax=Chitinophaga cymbidii TaxID=1096750 RepID=A0A512RHG3_9BACT|nr:DNA-directed RNA polymerase sigma-70 factor [Chitinophaga cymbidii]
MLYNGLHNERELLLRVADGDESAFKELLYAYSDHLGAFVYKVTASREISQEIVQDVFIKIWNARASLPGIERFSQYLFILTRNLTYNYIRDQSRASLKYQQWLHDMEHQGGTENIIHEEDGLARYLPIIGKAIEQLPPQQKKVFELARKQGLSHRQIAEEMGLSTETVKKYMKLALQAIREYVRDKVPSAVLAVLFLFF